MDEYPNDPKLVRRSDGETTKPFFDTLTISILIIIVFTILFLTFFIVRKRPSIKYKPETDEEILQSLKTEVLTGEGNDDVFINKHELESLLHYYCQEGELSKETEEFVENLIDDSD